MKTTLFSLISLLVAGLFSIAPAEDWAPVATDVAVSIDHTRASGVPDVAVLPAIGLNLDIFKGVKAKQQTGLRDKGEKQWFVLNIPLKIHARGRKKEGGRRVPARYIDELHLQVYILTAKPVSEAAGKGSGKGGSSASEADRYYLLKKEIVLQDIPMEKDPSKNEEGKEVGKAEVPVGIFLPRATVFKLTGKFDDPMAITRPGCIVGYAVLATFHGEKCHGVDKDMEVPGETSYSKLYSKKLANKIGSSRWWEERASAKLEKPGFPLMCISETPYAIYYGLLYPATKPILGVIDEDSRSSSEGTTNSGSSSDASGTTPSSSSSSSSGTSSTF